MRRFVFVFLVSSLLVTFAFVQRGIIPAVKASSSIYQGDLILTGNNVTTIEGRFDINGSIMVEDNATLYLKNAFLNLTQIEGYQYNITLRNPLNGNPRLISYNSTITSNYQADVYLFDNSTATVNSSMVSWPIYALDYSVLSISSGSHLESARANDFSVVSIYDSTINSVSNYGSSEGQVYDSETNYLYVGATSVNSTISKLEPGFISYWNFVTNCSVNILSGGYTPNVTLANTTINNWLFVFYGYSNVTILNSTIRTISAAETGVISLRSTTCYSVTTTYAALFITSSSITFLTSYGGDVWLLNSTYNTLYLSAWAKVYVSWYLDVHVIDSFGQGVPSANVTATYPNATVAASKLTDANGWAKLTLMEKMMNATDEYRVGNYTIEATYYNYSDATTVNMTENKQIALTLEDFIIPEFPSFLILPLFMIATILAVIIYRRKYSA